MKILKKDMAKRTTKNLNPKDINTKIMLLFL